MQLNSHSDVKPNILLCRNRTSPALHASSFVLVLLQLALCLDETFVVIALILTGASGVSILLRGTYGSVSSAAQERGEDGMGWDGRKLENGRKSL